jgi:hypothetical protein
MKNTNDTMGNRSCDLPVCSTVPQPLRHHVPKCKQISVTNEMVHRERKGCSGGLQSSEGWETVP